MDGDSVTFAYTSDPYYCDDGYGYYAVVSRMPKTTEEQKNDEDIYVLMDEPLHYITLTKKSSYDGSIVAGAEFNLKGTSDNGNYVDATAVSDKDTGTIRFNGLESGTYVLHETKAPKGYEVDDQNYIVSLAEDGNYTISGLSKSNEIYDFYDQKLQDKTITVQKVWDDGKTHNDPNNLAVTITTDVPQQSARTYSIKFDANGGSFGNAQADANGNTLTYNAKNEVTSGTYTEPEAADPENYYFAGWSASAKATSADSSIKTTPNDTTNKYLNEKTAGSTTTLYAVYQERSIDYYSMQPYGIEVDEVANGEVSGITFGPSYGNMFAFNSYWPDGSRSVRLNGIKYRPELNAHKISDTTYLINDSCIINENTTVNNDHTATDKNGDYVPAGTTVEKGVTTITKEMSKADTDAVQPENEPALTDNGSNAIVGDDAGTDELGNAYRCIHYDNWNTILYWNDHDPHVYDKCVKNHCSKTICLRIGRKSYISPQTNNYQWDILLHDTSIYDNKSDSMAMTEEQVTSPKTGQSANYKTSLARALLTGNISDRKAFDPDIVNQCINKTTCIYNMFPKIIRDHMASKKIIEEDLYGNAVQSVSPYYDKLWVPTSKEIGITVQAPGFGEKGRDFSQYPIYSYDGQYKARGFQYYFDAHVRNFGKNGKHILITYYSRISYNSNESFLISPGFVLKRDSQPKS